MFKLENVNKIYENGCHALRDINLVLEGNGLVAIIGKSGCGKTTLMNLLSNQDDATSGIISYNGIEYADKSMLKKTTNEFAFVYQDYRLLERLSGLNNRNELDEILNDMDISELAQEKVSDLSGGQKQRVAIARALVRKPQVLFADEPTGNFDSYNAKIIYEILRRLSHEIMVVIVTHDVDSAELYADKIIEMKDGAIVGEREILAFTQSEEALAQSKYEPTTQRTNGKLSLSSIGILAKWAIGKTSIRQGTFILISVFLLAIIIACISMMPLSYGNYFGNIMKQESSDLKFVNGFLGEKNKIKDKYCELSDIERILSDEYMVNYAKAYRWNYGFFDSTEMAEYYGIDCVPSELNSLYYDGRLDTKTLIISSDLKDIGTNLVFGNMPRRNQLLIPKTMADACIIMGVAQNYEGLIGKALNPSAVNGAMPISGIFNDYYELSVDAMKINSTDGLNGVSDALYKASSVYGNAVLVNSVIASPEIVNYVSATALVSEGFDDYFAEGQLELTLSITPIGLNSGDLIINGREKVNSKAICYNEYTVNLLSGIEYDKALGENEILMQSGLGYQIGDKINLKAVLETVSDGTLNFVPEVVKTIITNDEFEVVGYAPYFCFAENNWQKILNNVKFSPEKLVFSSNKLSASDINNINDLLNRANNPKYDDTEMIFIYNNNFYEVDIAYGIMRDIQWTILAPILIGLLIMLSIMNYLMLNVAIRLKEYSIATLRSLGMRNWETVAVFSIQGTLCLLVQFVLGIGMGIGLIFIVDSFLQTTLMTIFMTSAVRPLGILGIVAMTLGTVVLSLVLSVFKMYKKKTTYAYSASIKS